MLVSRMVRVLGGSKLLNKTIMYEIKQQLLNLLGTDVKIIATFEETFFNFEILYDSNLVDAELRVLLAIGKVDIKHSVVGLKIHVTTPIQ